MTGYLVNPVILSNSTTTGEARLPGPKSQPYHNKTLLNRQQLNLEI